MSCQAGNHSIWPQCGVSHFRPCTGETNGHYVGYCESFSHDPEDRFSYDPRDRYPDARRANEAVSAITKKSANDLEDFMWEGGQNPMRWPGEDTVSLPRLLRLELSEGNINAINFQKWMAGMPSLQELLFAQCKCEPAMERVAQYLRLDSIPSQGYACNLRPGPPLRLDRTVDQASHGWLREVSGDGGGRGLGAG